MLIRNYLQIYGCVCLYNTKKRTNILFIYFRPKGKTFVRLEKLADKSESIRPVVYFVCVYILFYLYKYTYI